MEPTQDMGCIPDYSSVSSQRQHSEQIAYIGICGKAYPIKYGRNTIGRHPDSDICIDVGSISKSHAVINIANKDDIKLMDCGSLNRTKLKNQTLAQYQAMDIRHNDIVQFGSEVGIFRLCDEEDDELPETQHLPLTQVIPDTPVPTRSHQRMGNLVIPESPDIDDGFVFKRPSNISLNKTPKNNQQQNVTIHDLETQLPILSMDNGQDNIAQKSGPINKALKTISCKGDSDDEILFEDIDDDTDISCSQTLIGDVVPEMVETTCIKANSSINKEQHCNVEKTGIDIHQIITEKIDEIRQDDTIDNQFIKCNMDSESTCVNDLKSNIEELPTQVLNNVKNKKSDLRIHTEKIFNNIHEMPTQDVTSKSDLNKESNFEDLPTQIINNCDISKSLPIKSCTLQDDVNIEDLPTQIINNSNINMASRNELINLQNIANIEDLPTQIFGAPDNDIQNMATQIIVNSDIKKISQNVSNDKQNDDLNITDLPTQIICDIQDMPTQIISSHVVTGRNDESEINDTTNKIDVLLNEKDEDVLTQIVNVIPHVNNIINNDTDVDIQDALTQIIVTLSNDPAKPVLSSNSSKNNDDNVNEEFLNKNPEVTILRKSGSSELSLDTPKKILSKGFVEVELPNTQDIKEYLNSKPERVIEQVSSESEDDICKENSPVLFRPNRRVKKDITLDFAKNLETLTKVSTRTRKPTPKIQAAMADLEKKNKNASRTNFSKVNDSFSEEIVIGNLSRLQNYIKKDTENNENNNSKSEPKNPRKRNSKDKAISENISYTKHQENKPNKLVGDTISVNNTKKIETPNSKCKKRKSNKKDNELNIEITTKINNKEEITNANATEDKHDHRSNKYERSTRVKKEVISVNEKKESKKEHDKTTEVNKIEKGVKNNRTRSKKSEEHRDNKKESKTVIPVKIKIEVEKSVSKSDKNQGVKRKFQNEDNNKTVDINKIISTYDDSDNGLRRSKRIRNITSERNVKEIVSILKKPTANHNNLDEESIESGTRPSYGRNINSTLSTNPFKHINDQFSGRSLDLRTSSARIVKTPHILFSAFPDAEKKSILAKMGAIMAIDVRRCTVLATCKFSRTFKILCAIGLGKPIVGDEWFKACVKSNTFVDPWQNILQDKASESRYNFNLKQVLQGKRNVLKGYTVTSTPTVAPTKNEMKVIVECSGGTWGESKTGKWLCVTCDRDNIVWPDLRKRGAILVVVELILAGVLKQKLDLKQHTIIKS